MSDDLAATCAAGVEGIDGTLAALACWLPRGHDGPHYDVADDLQWLKGKADEPRTDG